MGPVRRRQRPLRLCLQGRSLASRHLPGHLHLHKAGHLLLAVQAKKPRSAATQAAATGYQAATGGGCERRDDGHRCAQGYCQRCLRCYSCYR